MPAVMSKLSSHEKDSIRSFRETPKKHNVFTLLWLQDVFRHLYACSTLCCVVDLTLNEQHFCPAWFEISHLQKYADLQFSAL